MEEGKGLQGTTPTMLLALIKVCFLLIQQGMTHRVGGLGDGVVCACVLNGIVE